MNARATHRIGAAAVFVLALVLYVLTVSPTVSFWDPGERIAVSHGLQIPHPPGAPFYMLVGRAFSMFVPAEHVARAVNMISVLASALTVLLAYWIIHLLLRAWRGPRRDWRFQDHVIVLAGAGVGSLTLAVSDTFWFNALEAETYAFSTLFTALCVFLALTWRDYATNGVHDLPPGRRHLTGAGADRWLLLIAYLYGLAIGVHLLSLLSLFFVALIVFFDRFERPHGSRRQLIRGLAVTTAVGTAGFLVLYPGIIQVLPQVARASGAPVAFFTGLVVALAAGIHYTHRRRLRTAHLTLLCVTFVMIGYSSYALIVIRSAANPPIDQNDPENVDAFISYVLREQYGHAPLLKGPGFDNRTGAIDPDEERLLPRRHSTVPEHIEVYARYPSDWEFFWKYQVGHMYVRYLLWNFVGRAADVQGAPPITGVRFVDGPDPYLRTTPSEKASRKAYYGLPFLLGVMGAAFHFRRDWRRALAVSVLFFVTSVGIVLYLNQTPLQPRERDYSYAGSFFAFSLWIGVGAAGILQLTLDGLRRWAPSVPVLQRIVVGFGAAILLLAVPGWMGIQNYFDHDRSGNYVARDYAYNFLTSTDEQAVLFTNGDNDTFPLWYLQEVEGVRRDVRVANLELLNTPWYARQLKHQWSRESAPLPIAMPDSQIDRLSFAAWRPRIVRLPGARGSSGTILGDGDVFGGTGAGEEVERNIADTSAENGRVPPPSDVADESGQAPEDVVEWHLTGRPYAYSDEFNVLYPADQVVFDVVRTNAVQGWPRPIYFATTVGRDNQLDLQEHLRLEGMAFRIVPERRPSELDRIDAAKMDERLRSLRFTRLNDPSVYFDANVRVLVDQYRILFSRAALALAAGGERASARSLLEHVMIHVPFDTVAGNENSIWSMARAYVEAGEHETAADVLARAEPIVLHRLVHADSVRDIEYAAGFARLMLATYVELGRVDEASTFSRTLADATGNEAFYLTPGRLRQEFERPSS